MNAHEEARGAPAPVVPHRWHEERRPRRIDDRAGQRQRRIFAVLCTMLTLAGATVGLLSWLQTLPRPYFVPLWVADYKSPQLPVRAQVHPDWRSLRAGRYFPRLGADAFANQERPLLVTQLQNLRSLAGTERAIVYLSAFARGTGDKGIAVFPADADADDPQTWLPLCDVLRALADCPAQHKLLILDIMSLVSDPTLGVLADDVAARVEEVLDEVSDPPRLVLAACSPGQTADISEVLGHSLFVYYLKQGLDGWADGYNPRRERDGRVSVRELAAFVRARVDRWARNNRQRRQTPVLFGDAGDWELIALEHGRPKPSSPPEEPASYPAWLHDAWKLRDQWGSDDSWRLDPRTFQRLQALLLRAEQRWRGGDDPQHIQSDLQDQLKYLQNEMEQARRAVPQPESVRSLALVSQRHPPDKALIEELQTLLLQIESQTRDLKADKAEAVQSKITTAFLDKIKDRPNLDLTQAVFAAAVADPDPRPQHVHLLWQLLATRSPRPMFVETVFLRRLAELAEQMQSTGWPEEIIHRALSVVADGEKAASQAATFPWVRPMLHEAAQDRHDAEARLWARGYASLNDADRLLKRAADRYQKILLLTDKVQQAKRLRDEALAFLPAIAPVLDHAPEWEKGWFHVVEAASDLQDALAPPVPEAAASAEQIQQIVENVWQKSEALRAILDDLRLPVQPEYLSHLREQAVRAAGPTLVRQMNAILNTPVLSTDQRAALWKARQEAARRRDAQTLRLDRDDDRLGRVTPEPESGVGPQQVMAEEYRRALDRGRRSLALLRLGGLQERVRSLTLAALTDLERALASKQKVEAACGKLGEALRSAWSEQVPAQLEQTGDRREQDRLAWVAPPLVPSASLDNPAVNPRVQERRRQAVDLWTWLADRYLYEFREAVALEAPRYVQAFYEEAASDYRQIAGPTADHYLRLRSDPTRLPLAVREPGTEYLLPLGLSASPAVKPPVHLTTVTADDDWLEVAAKKTRLTEQPNAKTPTRSWVVPLFVRLKPEAIGSETPLPRGFLVEASAGGQSYHYLVPLSLLQAADRLEVLLSANAQQPTDLIGDLHLRPLRTQQAFFLYLRNPGRKNRKVVVRLKANNLLVSGGEVKLDLPARATQRVTFPSPAAAATGTTKPQTAKEQAAVPLEELTGPLEVEVRDQANANSVLGKRIIQVGIARPTEYVRVAGIRFDPGDAAAKRKNRLSVDVAALPPLSGPPPVATLSLPPDRIPGLLGIGAGNFRGLLPASGKEMTLFAEDIRLAEGADEEGYVYLGVDNAPRSLIYRVSFARQGNPVTPRQDDRPAVRLQTARYARPSDPLAVTVETDNAPLGAHLELTLGQMHGGDFTAEIVRRYPTARRRHIGFRPHGPGGALLFEASIQDWTDKLDIHEVLGDCLLRARLLDRDGNELGTAVLPLTVQDKAPEQVRFVHLPKQARPGTVLTVQATGNDRASGIGKVLFFLGKPVEDKVPKDAAAVAGEKGDGNLWSAQLPLPADKKGFIDVSVQLVNAAGLSRFATASLELVDRIAAAPGTIHGKVMEGALPQAGIRVALQDEKDEKGKAIRNATTKADGSFVFDKVAPGKYKLSAAKESTERKAESTVTVTADKTMTVTMELYR